jgi:Zn-dependent peptidase ImmA (M78 family)
LSAAHPNTFDGARAAASEHARLGTPLDAPIDVFDVIQRSGIWLMFQPLRNLYGAYERVGDAAGIIINAKQPPSLQRFTAAHEYGHHVLGHAPSLDDETHIQPDGELPNPGEQAAQTFAAHFLMPPQLVETALGRLGLPASPARLTPQAVYLLSLELGVSYAATVNQLAMLGKIERDYAAALRRFSPKQIKAEIAQAPRARNDRVDTWLLREEDRGRVLRPRVLDELYTYLPEMPSSGYLWSLITPQALDTRAGSRPGASGTPPLALLRDDFEAAPSAAEGLRYGAGATRRLAWRVLRPGQHRLELAQRRPWLRSGAPARTWTVDLHVAAPQTGEAKRGLSEWQKPLLVAAQP